MGTPAQFIEQSMNSGFDQGVARKQQLTDEERQYKAGQYIDTGKTQMGDLRELEKAGLKDSQQYKDLLQQFGNTQDSFHELFHPIKYPGALQRSAHYLLDKLHPGEKLPTSTTSQTPELTPNSPAAPLVTPELPASQQTTMRLPSQGGPVTTTTPGTASQTAPGMTAPVAAPLLVTQSFGNDPVPGMTAKGNADLAKTDNIDNGDGTHSSTFSMSFGTDKGEVLVPGVGDGKTYPKRQLRVLYTLPDGSQKWAVPGNQPHNWIAPERPTPQNNEALNQYQKTGKNYGTFEDEKAADAYGKKLHEDQEKYGNNGVTAHPVSPLGNVTIPAGAPVTVTKSPPVPWAQGQVQKLKDAAMAKAQKEAGLLAAGAPLSPSQEGQAQASGQAAQRWGGLRADIANWDKDNPNASKEDRDATYQQLYSKWVGTTGKGNWETLSGTVADPADPTKRVPVSYAFDKSTNRLTNLNGTPVNSDVAASFMPDPKASGTAAQDLKDYQNDPDPNKGSFATWKAKQSGLGRNAAFAAKPPNRDDRYIDILKKQQAGKLTPDDIAYKNAYDLWVDKTKVAPGVARMAAMNDDRYVWVYNQSDPDKELHPMRMKDAMKAPVGSPQSIAFKTDAAITKYMTSGQGATNINYFNTAVEHLKLLQEAGDNLNNGNIQAFNNIAQQFGIATGQPEAVEFNAVKSAVAGELSKTFKGTGATDAEIADINQTINAAQSPEQITGAVDYYTRLMGGKMKALEGQYTEGKQGKPNFPGTTPPLGGGNGAGKFPVKIPGTNKTKYFPTQAAADLFKKEANIP